MPTLPFSIIVPVYNDENNLKRCLDGIVSQSFMDFECLLIDDGSTDNSSTICDEYAAKNSRIRVFHKNNEGISKTRQFGINNSTGRFTVFVDSDDWIESELLMAVIQEVKNEKTDMLFMDFFDENSTGKEKYLSQQPFVKNSETVLRMVLEGKISSCLWNVVINRELYIIHNIDFPDGINYGEDSLFIIELLLNNPKINHLSKAYYHHTYNHDSFTLKNRKQRFMERAEFIDHLPLLLDKYNRNNLIKHNFFPLNDKYEMLYSGLFTRKEYQAIFPIANSSYYRKQCGFKKNFMLILAETRLYLLAKCYFILVRWVKNKLIGK